MECERCKSEDLIELDREDNYLIHDEYNHSFGYFEQWEEIHSRILLECRQCGNKFIEYI